MIEGAMHRLAVPPASPKRVALALALLSACGGGPPPPEPVPIEAPANQALAPLSSHGTPPQEAPRAATRVERPDPAEAGISDLARLARYVFREMGAREESCRLLNPFHERLGFVLRIEVKQGRMRSVALSSARLERDGGPSELPEAQWPQALRSYVACLE